MAVQGVDHRQLLAAGDALGQHLLLTQRVQAVGVDAGDHRASRDAGQGLVDAAASTSDVVRVHRAGEHQVGVGVEAPDQLGAVVLEVGRDGEPAVVLDLAPEPLRELRLAAVRDVGDASREREAGHRAPRGAVVVAAVEVGVGGDGGLLRGGVGDLLGRGPGRRGEQEQPHDPVGHRDGPLERAHATGGAADHGLPAVDAKGVGHGDLGRDLVADRERREAAAPRLPVGREARRARGALAPTEDVGRHDEPAIGVDRPPGTDEVVPPAGGGVARAHRADDVRVSGERVLDQHRVVAREGAPRLVGHPHRGKLVARLQHHAVEVDELPGTDRISLPPRTGDEREIQGRA